MLIENTNQGILVKCNDITGLENAIKSIIYDNTVLKRMSSGARERAKSFESSKIFREWEVYLNLIG